MLTTDPQFILASASPRRRHLLQTQGFVFSCQPANCEEHALPDESPEAMVQRLARTKASHAAAHTDLPVLAADTIIDLDGEVLGKPDDRRHAKSMLLRMSGRKHHVLTAISLIYGDKCDEHLSRSRVTMCRLDRADIDAYCDTGECDDKAGAYAIQGRGAAFIATIAGSYTGIVGLPLAETMQLLRRIGIRPRR